MSDKNLLKEMGERIYLRRKFLKWTQEELAEKLGVSTQMISNLETGKKAIRPENLLKVCKVLDISADYVLGSSYSNATLERVSSKLVNLTDTELGLVEGILDYMNGKK